MAKIKYMTEEDIIAIRTRLANTDLAQSDAFGPIEPLDKNKLGSAVFRQHTGAGGKLKYKTVPEIASTLFYGITLAHAFENANKRTATVSMLIFLDQNKYMLLDTTEEDLYNLAKGLAEHSLIETTKTDKQDDEVKHITEWINQRSRAKILGDQTLSFPQLRSILEEMDCTFDKPNKNFIKIRRGKWMVKTGFPKHDFDVDLKEVKRIRGSLHLDEIHGTDSSGFYNLEGEVDKFVNKYRNLMKWLADL